MFLGGKDVAKVILTAGARECRSQLTQPQGDGELYEEGQYQTEYDHPWAVVNEVLAKVALETSKNIELVLSPVLPSRNNHTRVA